MRIYLTGFMASGKSSIGKALAKELKYAFVDLDTIIENQVGKSVEVMFAEDGEEAFRRAEKDALRDTIKMSKHVIALGGGAVANEEDAKWAADNGVVVFLDVPEDELVARLLRSRVRRPLVEEAQRAADPLEALESRVAGLMAKRRPFYEAAELVFKPQRTTTVLNARRLARRLAPIIDRHGDQ